MFTGIIETLGVIKDIRQEGSNRHFQIESAISEELKIDQSVSHNGVCLTVVGLGKNVHTVTAINETLQKTTLADWKAGDKVNLERCLAANGRFDGHIVQGHVDLTGICQAITDQNGSWVYRFGFPEEHHKLIVPKGSICVNGVSLTVVKAGTDYFTVAIIPYTHEHTTFHAIKIGDRVNLEFDVIGKYVARMLS